jgi:exodeoxyribonuclease VII large subunit
MRVLTVSQALGYLRELIESDIVLGDVWVSGEVSGPRSQPSGHTYFTLKDANAQLRSVLFRSAAQRQKRMLDHLTQGAQVIVHGRMTVYEARGEIQISVDFVQPEGVGLRHAQFERLRLQLEEEGLFDATRKRLLPRFPRRVGVVTSPSGAVFHDICNVLTRRWPLTEVVLAPTPVQGPEATFGIAGGIETLNGMPEIDVIIVARGGGSIEELWAFNEERVARAVFGSVIPVVSAVGHETDVTICDYVADLRAPTPSAAAELVVPDVLQMRGEVEGRTGDAFAALQRLLSRSLASVGALSGRAERTAADVERLRSRVASLADRGLHVFTVANRDRHAQLQRCQAALDALDPQATLNRGYAVVHKGGRVVSAIEQIFTGDDLVIKVADGGFPARVGARGQRRAPRHASSPNGNNGASDAGERSVQPVLFP